MIKELFCTTVIDVLYDMPKLYTETNCSREALVAPKNGALACSQWTHGELCQMQCQQGFDIPAISNNGLFVCGKSTGLWLPSAFVPSCSRKSLRYKYIYFKSLF